MPIPSTVVPGVRGVRRSAVLAWLAVALATATAALAAPAAPPGGRQENAASRLIAAALADSQAAARLAELCDTCGPRLPGSAGLDCALAWALARMRADGLAAVRAETVLVPHWVRGEERAECVAPVRFPLRLLGLGGTVGTPAAGLEADLLCVRDFAELEARGGEARGRIVLFDQPWEGYGKTVQYRARGADAAARHGAVACLIRSVTGTSLANPHTGVMHYEDRADSAWTGVPMIPAAALTVEDAGRLRRLANRGLPARVRLYLGARTLPDTVSANIVGEVRGRERPDEIVLIGAHLDSWDVGTGAHDDGAGCVIVMEAARLIARLPQPPRRTLRVVLFVDEEQTQAGGRAYATLHADELARHVAALECDSGGFPPVGFSVQADSSIVARVRELAGPLATVGATEIGEGYGGVDISFIVAQGVPGIGHRVDSPHYMDYHHSPADTFDKVDARDLALSVAAVAGLAWALAEDPAPLRPPVPAP